MIFEREKLVRFAQCDPAGIMFYPRYFEIFNELVEDWFAEGLGISFKELHQERRLGTPTIHADCDFLKPSRVGDVLHWALTLKTIGRSSFTFAIEAYCGTEARIKGGAVLVCTSLGEEIRTQEIPDYLRAAMQPYLESS